MPLALHRVLGRDWVLGLRVKFIWSYPSCTATNPGGTSILRPDWIQAGRRNRHPILLVFLASVS